MDFQETENQSLAQAINDEMKKAVMPVTVFVGIEIVLGFFGNILVLYVFLFRYHKCNFRYFVLCLAVTDITSTLTTMPGEMVTQLNWYTYPVPLVCKVKSFFNMFTVSSEAMCLLTIAVDRYRKVCHPHGWQIKPRVARILCFAIYGVAFIISFPVPLFWGVHKQVDKYRGTNVTTTVCEIDQKYVNTEKPLDYSLSIEILISISLVGMFMLYVLIARALLCTGVVGKGFKAYMQNVKAPGTDRETRPTEDISLGQSHISASVVSSSSMSTCSNTAESDCVSDDKIEHRSNTIRKENTLAKEKTGTKVRRKTMIMFILTVTFIITTIMYLTLLSFIADDILPGLSNSERAVYFFFFRFYFINHVINPIVYGVLDPKFRKIMFNVRKWVSNSLGPSTSSIVSSQ